MTNLKRIGFGVSAFALAIAAPALAATSTVVQGFAGATLVQNQTVGGGFIPPDTMGAVGTTQYVEIINGSYSVYSKATGTQLSFIDDDAFWSAAGATDFNGAAAGGYTNGDPRILFDATRNRWIASAFGGDTSFLNIAVSDTADALGPWKATTFLAFNGVAGAGVADYQTLAMDRNAVYIGTNNFDTAGFIGTTLNVVPIGDIFSAVAPNVANRAQFSQLGSSVTSTNDRGFAIQGVNSNAVTTTGNIVADGAATDGVAYKVNNAGGGSAGATLGATNILVQSFQQNGDARQPDGSRTLDALDTRIGSSVFEQNGKIYFTRTVTPNGTDYTASRITVLSATNFAVLQEFDITGGDYDYYQSSLAISAAGVVVGYNRSGFQAGTGNVAFYANAYTLDANGLLVFDATHLLKQSDNPAYSLVGGGRNRWGDYSSVTVDPTDSTKFWAIGEFANFRDQAQTLDGWGTWIGVVKFGQNVAAVPESSTWMMMIAGFGFVGASMRRRTRVTSVTYG